MCAMGARASSVSAAVLVVAACACGDNEPAPRRWTAETDVVSQFHLARFTTDHGDLSADAYAGTIGDEPVVFARLGADTVVAIVPELTGDHSVQIDTGDAQALLTIMIEPSPGPADPVAFATDWLASQQTTLDELRITYAGETEVIATIDAMDANLERLANELSTLPADEQRRAGRVLAANVEADAAPRGLSFNWFGMGDLEANTQQAIYDGIRMAAACTLFFASAASTAGTAGATAALTWATMALCAQQIVRFHSSMENLGYTPSQLLATAMGRDGGAVRSTQSDLLGPASITFYSNEYQNVGLSGPQRALASEDSVFPGTQVLFGTVVGAGEQWERSASYLSPAPGAAPTIDVARMMDQSVDGRVLSIDEASLTNGVTVVTSVKNAAGIATIVMHPTCGTDPQAQVPFAFDVVLDNRVTPSQRVPFQATLNCSKASCAVTCTPYGGGYCVCHAMMGTTTYSAECGPGSCACTNGTVSSHAWDGTCTDASAWQPCGFTACP